LIDCGAVSGKNIGNPAGNTGYRKGKQGKGERGRENDSSRRGRRGE